ncbi:hypothetical protein [Desmospora activa]|uniref:Uncharacterized protein n=1 Tax=Desmospora activa DSM 45169 TaxID=1121389 RepID=A0A2T4Z216_9BACL|nr:hypothetical protein [Desmospora activa]PTM54781.1 hypothetical protein C8J48_3433 [Desmospora activa DSM 45169]
MTPTEIDQEGEERGFRFWLSEMDNQLQMLRVQLPAEVGTRLDFSVESLLALEKWMLANFNTHQEMNADQKDQLARYTGEVLRKGLNGFWGLETREDHMFYLIPHVYPAAVCPLRLVTTAVSRNRGNFLHNMINRKLETVNRKEEQEGLNYDPNHPELQSFLAKRDRELQWFFSSIPAEIAQQLDFSPQSLSVLEQWMLNRYPDAESTKEDYKWMEPIQVYLGETFRKELGGQWFYCAEEEHPFAGFHILDAFYDHPDPLFPGDLIITCLMRRTGSYLEDILDIRRKRMLVDGG